MHEFACRVLEYHLAIFESARISCNRHHLDLRIALEKPSDEMHLLVEFIGARLLQILLAEVAVEHARAEHLHL